MIFGTVLKVVHQRELGGRLCALDKGTGYEGRDESRELQFGLNTVFEEILVAIAFKSLDILVGTTQFETKQFASPEHVAVLIGERGSRTEVAGGVGTFRLETDGMWLVGGELDVAVELFGSLVLDKGDVGVFDGLKTSEAVVGSLQVLGGIGFARSDEGVIAKHRRPEGYPVVLGVATLVVDVADGIYGVRPNAVARDGERMEHQCEIHLGHASHGVGPEGNVVLVETIVAPVGEILGDALALAVEVGDIELFACLERACAENTPLAQHTVDGCILDVVINVIDHVSHSGVEDVSDIHHLLLLGSEIHLNRSAEVALIAKQGGKVVAALLCLERVEQHGSLAHRLEGAVEPFGGVATCERVDAKGHLERGEPSLIASLTHIRLIFGDVDIWVALVLFHLHLIEHILPVGNEFRSRARGKQNAHNKHIYVSFNAHYSIFACKVKTLFVTLWQNSELII